MKRSSLPDEILMLLLNYRPDITGGSSNVIAILFDMNKLWEEFVYRRLKKEETNSDIIVQRQQSADFWKSRLGTTPKTIRPDIVVTHNNEIFVIDTKWKIVKDNKPDDNDLKQMFVYNLFWKSDKSILLYPSAANTSATGDYFDYLRIKEHSTQCCLETINILDDAGKLDRMLGKRIVEIILASHYHM